MTDSSPRQDVVVSNVRQVWVRSESDPNHWYEIDPIGETCTCLGFHYRKDCKHLRKVATQPDLFAEIPTEESMRDFPQVFTSRYFNYDLLESGIIVPVRVSVLPVQRFLEPPYEVKHHVKELTPTKATMGEWEQAAPAFTKSLDMIGPVRLSHTLGKIADENDGKPLALCCWEDITRARGQRCHRPLFSVWLEERTGIEIPEITNDGEVLHWSELHKRVMPPLYKKDK